MKLKIGKIFNSIKYCHVTNRLNCCLFRNFFQFSKPSSTYTKLDERSVNSSQEASTSKSAKSSNSCTNYFRLIYFTFFHNESNDILGFLETVCHPFIECFGRCLRIIGWVRYMLLFNYILRLKIF